jgi:hypothetical protein
MLDAISHILLCFAQLYHSNKKGRDDYDGSINDETLLLVLPPEPEEDVAGIDANVPLAMSRQFVTTL